MKNELKHQLIYYSSLKYDGSWNLTLVLTSVKGLKWYKIVLYEYFVVSLWNVQHAMNSTPQSEEIKQFP